MTYQPPGGPPPEGPPSYAQPQDPWAGGYEQGVASVPTDPIPQQYDAYPPGATPSDVWSQPTVMHGGQYAYAPQPRSKVGLFVLVFLLVLVLGGGGGFAAWYIVGGPPDVDPTSAPPDSGSTSAGTPQLAANCPVSAESGAFDPCTVKVNDCLINAGTAQQPDIRTSVCSAENSFTVIKISRGPEIKENAQGEFDKDTTSRAECQGTGFEFWYGYQDAFDDNNDVFFCLTKN